MSNYFVSKITTTTTTTVTKTANTGPQATTGRTIGSRINEYKWWIVGGVLVVIGAKMLWSMARTPKTVSVVVVGQSNAQKTGLCRLLMTGMPLERPEPESLGVVIFNTLRLVDLHLKIWDASVPAAKWHVFAPKADATILAVNPLLSTQEETLEMIGSFLAQPVPLLIACLIPSQPLSPDQLKLFSDLRDAVFALPHSSPLHFIDWSPETGLGLHEIEQIIRTLA